MRASLEKIRGLLQDIMGFAVVTTICIVSFSVFARLMSIPVAWSDEVVKIIFIWLVFIGSAVAYQSDSLIGLDLVEDMLSKKPVLQKGLKSIQGIFATVFGVFMTLQTFRIVSTQLQSGEVTPVLGFPLWLVNLGYLLGSLLFAVFAVQKLLAAVLSFQDRAGQDGA